MDKSVKYALLGGAAVVAAAVAYHFLTSEKEGASDDNEDGLNEDIKELGELQLDDRGNIDFDQFLQIFKMCAFYGKTHFASRRKELVAQRRQALKDGNELEYERIVSTMIQEEEMLVQNKLNEILSKLGISEEEFQKTTMFHGQDQRKGMQIMQMQ